MKPMEESVMEEVELNALSVHIAKRILTRREFSGSAFAANLTATIENGILTLHSFVWKEDFAPVTQTGYVEIPRNWAQHLKMQYAPAWFLRKWPVQTKKVELRLTCVPSVVYPSLPAQYGKTAKIFVVKEGSWKDFQKELAP